MASDHLENTEAEQENTENELQQIEDLKIQVTYFPPIASLNAS